MEQGCPVNIKTGHATTLPVRDFVLRGAFGDDIVFERIYDSGRPHDASAAPNAPDPLAASVFDSYLGAGWNHTFQSRLVTNIAGHVIYYREDGRSLDFVWNASKGQYDRPPGRPLSLTATPPGYVVQDLVTGEKRIFNAGGRLTRKETKAGPGIDLTYDQDGYLVGVANKSGQKIKLSYYASSHLLESVALDFAPYTAKLVTFGYGVTQRLSSVSYTQGTAYTFSYAGPGGRLDNVKRGARNVETFTYQTDGRVQMAKSADSSLKFTYDEVCSFGGPKGTRVDDIQAQANCPAGETCGMSCVVFDSITGLPTETYGQSAQSNAWLTFFDRRGLPLVVYDRGKIGRQYTYDDEGRLIYETFGNETSGNDQRRRRMYIYPACPSSVSCFLPKTVLEQGSLSETKGQCIPIVDVPGSSTNCITTTLTYDVGTWNLSTVMREGLTRDAATGNDKSFCYMRKWSYKLGGRVDGDSTWQDCTTSPPYVLNYSYYPDTGGLFANRLQSITATNVAAKTTVGNYDKLGRPTKVTIGDVAYLQEYDDQGQILSETVGATSPVPLVTTYLPKDGRPEKIVYPAGNVELLEYLPPNVSPPFSPLTKRTRTWPAAGGGTTPGNASVVINNHPLVGLPWRQSFYRAGTLERRLQWSFANGRVDAMKLTSNLPYQKLTYVPETGDLKSIESIATAQLSSLTTYSYDTLQGLLQDITQAKAAGEAKWIYEKDVLGNVTAVTDPHVRITKFTYDDLDRVVEIASPDSNITRLEYDAAGNAVKRVEGAGPSATYATGKRTVSYVYDTIGRLEREEADTKLGSTKKIVTYEYDTCANGNGLLCKVTDPSGSSELAYDDYGRLKSEKKSLAAFQGAETWLQYGYGGNGDLTAMTLKQGGSNPKQWTVSYESPDHDLSSGPDEPSEVWLTGTGMPKQLLADQVRWRSFLGDVASLRYGNKKIISSKVFDEDGYLKGETISGLGKPQQWTYSVDQLGRQTSATFSTPAVGRQYDPANPVQYDQLERLTKTVAPVPSDNREYSYDDTGNRDTVTRGTGPSHDKYCYESTGGDVGGPGCTNPPSMAKNSRLCRVIWDADASVDCGTTGDQGASQAVAAGSKAAWVPPPGLDAEYQKLAAKVANILKGPVNPGLHGRLHAVEQVVTNFLRKHNLSLPAFARALLAQPKVRAALLQVLAADATAIEAALQSLATEAGQVTLSSAAAPYALTLGTTYGYDGAGRLISEGDDLCYLYDEWGRLAVLGMPKTAGSCSEENVAPISKYGYDYRGRRVTRQRFGVIGLERPIAYFYDQLDRLVAEGYPGENPEDLVPTLMYIYLGGKPLAQLELASLSIDTSGCTGCGVASRLSERRGWLLLAGMIGLPALLVIARTWRRGRRRRAVTCGVALVVLVLVPLLFGRCVAKPWATPRIFYYHNDPVGTPLMLTDENAKLTWSAKYDDFGAVEEDLYKDIHRTPLRFPGQYDDGDKWAVGGQGPYYNLHRYYDPVIGRYITPDGIGMQIGNNVYSYVANDPINSLDVSGLVQIQRRLFTRYPDAAKAILEVYKRLNADKLGAWKTLTRASEKQVRDACKMGEGPMVKICPDCRKAWYSYANRTISIPENLLQTYEAEGPGPALSYLSRVLEHELTHYFQQMNKVRTPVELGYAYERIVYLK